MKEHSRHYEQSVIVNAKPDVVFAYADDHRNFSSHMNQSSWMMGGGRMNTQMDDKNFQEVGSHLKMDGTVLGIKLFLDEVVTLHEPPLRKEWQTVGDLKLLVIDHYKLGFEIKSENSNSNLRAYIDYDLPKSQKTKILGLLFSAAYAKWCVRQMLNGVAKHFKG
jgi:hypothetical protein